MSPSADGWPEGVLVAGKYERVEFLGSSATGHVYLARHSWTGRNVAIKLLRRDLAEDKTAVAKFVREARAAARIAHPNIIDVLDMGHDADARTFYIVEEHLVGHDLRSALARRGRLEPIEAAEILVPVMGALAGAHAAGVVHRNIDPDSILLADDDRGALEPKIIDFGLSTMLGGETSDTDRHDAPARVSNSEYIAPEQTRAPANADHRVDIFSVGVLWYRLLSGRSPFSRADLRDTDTAPPEVDPTRLEQAVPGVSPELGAAVHRALARSPDERFATMEDFLRAVLNCDEFASEHEVDSIANRHRAALGTLFPAQRERASTRDLPAARSPSGESHRSDALDDTQAGSEALGDTRAGLVALGDTQSGVAALGSTQAIGQQLLDTQAGTAMLASTEAGDAPALTSARAQLAAAEAHMTLGNLKEAEATIRNAVKVFDVGSREWCAAIVVLGRALAGSGRNEAVTQLAEQLMGALQSDSVSPAMVVAAAQLSVFLLWSGWPELSHTLLESVMADGDRIGSFDPYVRGCIERARAFEFAHAGDLGAALRFRQAAVASYTVAQDRLGIMTELANLGDTFKELGAWEMAERTLRQAVTRADEYKSGMAAVARINLGVVLAFAGKVDEARALIEHGRAQAETQQNPRLEAYGWIYTAMLELQLERHRPALDSARQAFSISRRQTAPRAFALALVAQAYLGLHRIEDALVASSDAVDMSSMLGGIGEGETRVWLASAESLLAASRTDAGRDEIARARGRLLERAAHIRDEHWRRSFLNNVPENARILALAREWLGSVDDEPRTA